MQFCSAHGVSEFILALGYQGPVIKDYFQPLQPDLSLDLRSGKTEIDRQEGPDWRIHFIDTGSSTMTGGRLKRLAHWLRDEPHFLMTYGDGLANINLRALEQYHASHGRLATVTAVRVPERFGRLTLDGDKVTSFQEKPDDGRPWVNGGFFVLSPKTLDYIEGDDTIWEQEPLERLSTDGELRAFRHDGFWSCVDTPGDLSYLESIWDSVALTSGEGFREPIASLA
jgi:glucose-1-phosphate cytidylyltransferase